MFCLSLHSGQLQNIITIFKELLEKAFDLVTSSFGGKFWKPLRHVNSAIAKFVGG